MRLSLLLFLSLPATLSAQVVRGVVRDSASREPAPGVLVALIQPGLPPLRTALTDEDGRFTIAAPAPGTYALETKRIGVRSERTASFTLGTGEAREVSLTVAAVVALLETVRVTGRSYCGEQVTEGAETATLWGEVHAALTATRLTRSRSFPVTITSFKRTLDPASFAVRSEERHERHGVASNPISSAPPASLSAHGYIVSDGTGHFLYSGPDVDVLLSDMFVRDHCFRAIIGNREQAGLVGLSFEPTSARKVPDIAGVLWIDARTRALRRLEYKYTRAPIEMDGRFPISYVDYARLPSGAWIVQRWVIRMPRMERVGGHDAPRNPLVVSEPPRTRLVAVLEEGAEVLVGAQQASRIIYAIEGTVFDSSAARPLAGARVSLRGTPFATTSSASGHFRLQLPDSGTYLLGFDHSRLDSLGFEAPARAVHVAGALANADLAVPPLTTVRGALCPGSRTPEGSGVLHGIVRKPDRAPAAWATLRYRWAHFAIVTPNAQSPLPATSSVPVTASAPGATFVADSRGRYIICDVPPGRYQLTLESDTGQIAEADVTIDAGAIVARELVLRRR